MAKQSLRVLLTVALAAAATMFGTIPGATADPAGDIVAATAGTLTHTGCVSNAAIAGCTTAPAASLDQPFGMVVSPDGNHAYTAGTVANAVTSFDIAADGTLTHTGCISNTAIAGCTTAPAASLAGATSVAVSPDGTHLYAAAISSSAVTLFDIAADGTLTHTGCISSFAIAGCTTAPTISMAGAAGVAVAPDGTQAYAASAFGAVTSFDIAADGTLTHTGCVSNAAIAGCTTAPAASLDQPFNVAVSPDGDHTYTASTVANAVTSFDIAADGTLAHTGCVSNAAIAGCTTAPAASLDGLRGLSLSPDGTHAYTTSTVSNAVTSFDIAADGTLTHTGCVSNAAIAGCTTAPAASLDLLFGLAVSPDGTQAYTTGLVSNAVTSFDIAADGTLAHTGCVSNGPIAGCNTAPAASLEAASSVAVSPDGTHAYATGGGDRGAVTSFDIEVPPTRLVGAVTESAAGPSSLAVGDPIAGVFVVAFGGGAAALRIDVTAADGTYAIDVPPGSYGLNFVDPVSAHDQEFHDDSQGTITMVPVAEGETVTIDAGLFANPVVPPANPATVSGTITDADGALEGALVAAISATGRTVGIALAAPDGTYTLTGLPAADTYFIIIDVNGVNATEWHDDATGPNTATPITLTPGGSGTVDAVLAP